MSLLNLFWLFFAPTKGWRQLTQAKYSMHRLYLLHVIPLSLIPPLFIYYGSFNFAASLFPVLSSTKLLIVAVILFIIELVAVPLMALLLRQLAEIAEAHPTFQEAFTFAAVAPTPLWLMPIMFLIPDITVNLLALTLALMATVGFIYYGIPTVFRIKERGHAILLFGAVLTAGVIAWVFLMVATLVILGSVQTLQI